ncbi:MAG: phospho-N-acetylmuramoyl-pentapeptide-transferase [Clostridia bacterium]|nr:phospho-N-acetylmuramoyl-pentapeptide-transferase [Clostridia bacterium]
MRIFAIGFAAIALAVFGLTVLAERILIPILQSKKAGQKILEIGPRWHKSKEGTPTMGGLGFILPSLIVLTVFFLVQSAKGRASEYIPLSLTIGFAVMNGAIGFVDDYCKLIKKQNEGLTWKQKLLLQLVASAAYVCVMAYTGNLDTAVRIPFSSIRLELGYAAYPIAVLILAGVVNGANFTDGIDGLASSVTFVIGGFFAVLAFYRFDLQLSVVSAVLLGSTLGFLIYNFHPARVFMGDTGSLFLGGLVIAGAFQTGDLGMGLLISGVFIIEMLSSLLQRVYFKLTHGKRLFKMAPIHHHFEKCGWSENKIVLIFSLVELGFCLLAFAAM